MVNLYFHKERQTAAKYFTVNGSTIILFGISSEFSNKTNKI